MRLPSKKDGESLLSNMLRSAGLRNIFFKKYHYYGNFQNLKNANEHCETP